VAAKKKAAKKSAAKKSSAKRSVKRVAKRSTAKRSAKRKTKSSSRYSVPSVPVSGSGRSSVSTISTTPKSTTSASYSSKAVKSGDSSSNKGIVIAVVLGILILAIAVISRGSDSESTTVTPTPAASESVEPTTESTTAPLAAHEPPVGIVSIYNATGATVNWKAPAASEGITGYNIELRTNGVGEWRLVATVPATQFKQQITKNDESGWAQVKVSTVYSDGVVAEGKIHGLPGSWS